MLFLLPPGERVKIFFFDAPHAVPTRCPQASALVGWGIRMQRGLQPWEPGPGAPAAGLPPLLASFSMELALSDFIFLGLCESKGRRNSGPSGRSLSPPLMVSAAHPGPGLQGRHSGGGLSRRALSSCRLPAGTPGGEGVWSGHRAGQPSRLWGLSTMQSREPGHSHVEAPGRVPLPSPTSRAKKPGLSLSLSSGSGQDGWQHAGTLLGAWKPPPLCGQWLPTECSIC